jgi:hydrogenase maturation protease
MTDFWSDMARPGPATVTVRGVELRRGSRVRLRPAAYGDVLDVVLGGRTAVVEGIDQDDEARVRLAVTLEDDPGRDLGDARQPGHRFFFAPEEVEPLAAGTRVLVAGIGNVFLGDDGFGVAVARRLAARPVPPGVLVADFGIRGLDLAYALQEEWAAVILVDAAPRGHAPGTLYVIEPDGDGEPPALLDGHAMDPVRVLALARRLGRVPARVVVVGCEPLSLAGGAPGEDALVELSAPVARAVGQAVELVESMVHEISSTDPSPGKVVA